MTEINDKKLVKNFDDSMDVMGHRLNSHSDEPLTKGEREQLEVAKLFFVTYPKIKAAQSQVAGVGLKILDAASENQEQYRQLVREHMPKISNLVSIPQLMEGKNQDIMEVKKEKQDLAVKWQTEKKAMQDTIDDLQFKLMQIEEKAKQH
jgi:hypothetical protein